MIRRNVLANTTAKLWAAAISLAAVPFYVRMLGIEAYGVIGFFLALGPVLSVLDLGLSTTLTRRLAQLSVSVDGAGEMRDLVRTLECAYWLVAVTLALGLVLLSPVLTAYWIKPQQLGTEALSSALGLMGVALACQWPLSLYSGGLMGTQRQVLASGIGAAAVTVRNVGAVLLLWQFGASLQVFFAWQIVVGLGETLITAAVLWRVLPASSRRARARLGALREVWKFAAGVGGISVLAVVLTQLDKLVLSRVLPLDEFGVYSLACRVAVGLYYLSGPINAAFFPRFSQLVAARDEPALTRLYHAGCQLLCVAVVPLSLAVAFFPQDFLRLWAIEPEVARSTGPLLSLLMVGSALNALMALPLALQLAFGWTQLVLIMNAAAVALLAPLIYFASLHYGAVGAAWVWIGLNCAYVLVLVPLMHRRVLVGEFGTWLCKDFFLPLAAALVVTVVFKAAVVVGPTDVARAFDMMMVTLLAIGASLLAAPDLRSRTTQLVYKDPR